MKMRNIMMFICALTVGGMLPVAGAAGTAIELTAEGETIKTMYAKRLADLREEVVRSLPDIDTAKATAFMEARQALSSLKRPGKEATGIERAAYKEAEESSFSNALSRARTILPDIEAFLGDDTLDDKLMEVAILSDATAQGLAEFAQQGKDEQELLNTLFGDNVLMKQMLHAGGANGGEWGEAMQVYTAILAASPHARETGTIFQRLALGTALQQPLLQGKESGGVYGIMHADASCPEGPVARYLHYEKAYLDGELDPAFKDFNTWECRFIGNDPYTHEELAWTREMLRNYRPDHIMNPDYRWRYAAIVKTDVPYCSPDFRPNEGTTKVQQIVAGGGKCGPRAFFGRTSCRAFGIPSRKSTQTGHAAMNHWTPDGWVVLFGAWWGWNWAGPWGGLDFFLESRVREYPEDFMNVLRAQWVGDALGEEDVNIKYYGRGGGLWNSLAFHKKEIVIADAQAEALQAELAALSEEEAKVTLGETDEAADEVDLKPMPVIRPEDKTMAIDHAGVITVPAAACELPTNHTERIIFMNNLDGEAQIHYARLGKRPELIKYEIEVPAAGMYNLTLRVCNVARDQTCLLRLNRRTLIDLELPDTWGKWEETLPVAVELKEGRNTLMFTCKTPNRGVSLKRLTLTPDR